jgi:predicted DsbA family dithiol-disulfide isomerase
VLVCNLQVELGKAQRYGVKAVPSVVVDGMLVLTGKPSRAQLEAVGIIQIDSSCQEFNYLGMHI